MDGIIYSHKPHSNGYIQVCMVGNISKMLHVLVALAFVDNSDPSIKKHVNHINGVRHDNRAVNLE